MAEETAEFVEPIVKFPTTISLETCKSKFFTGEVDGFMEELRIVGKFRVYSSYYVDVADLEGCPGFAVRNLVNGFPKQLEDKRKFLFTAFRCTKAGNSYEIRAMWITNTTVPIDLVATELYDSFDHWTELDMTVQENLHVVRAAFVRDEDDPDLVVVSYLH